MWTTLKSVFKNKTSNIDNNLYNIVTINGLESIENVDVINKLKRNEVDGFVIKDVIDKTQLNTLLEYYNSLEERGFIQKEGVGSYPISFLSLLYGMDSPKKYFTENHIVGEDVKERTGFDLQQFFISTISKFNGGKKVIVKPNNFLGGTFAPFNFRSLTKSRSNIQLHCEDCHHTWAPPESRKIGLDELQPGAIPYYITLQKSEGGKLILFDVTWQIGQYTEEIDNDHHRIVNPDGTKIDCSPKGIKRMEVETEPGDLIIFNGHKIWHMVDRVQGEEKRLTLGAFLNTTLEGELEIWA